MFDKDAFIFALLGENHQLRKKCTTDALTGIGSRLKFQIIYDQVWRNSYRYSESMAIIAADIDDFKSLNSTLGHDQADKVICEIASIIACNLRLSDTVCRYGGDEFVIVAPKTDTEEAIALSERLRSLVEETGYTISLGASGAIPAQMHDQPKLLSAAFLALKEAKESGKNCVCLKSMFLNDAIMRSRNSDNRLKII